MAPVRVASRAIWHCGVPAAQRPIARLAIGAGAAAGLAAAAYLDYRFAAAAPVSLLYVFPILLAATTFRYVGGLVAAVAATLLYHLTHSLLSGAPLRLAETDALRVLRFVGAGWVMARLAADHRRQRALAGEWRSSRRTGWGARRY